MELAGVDACPAVISFLTNRPFITWIHLRIEDAKNLDGGDVDVDYLVCVGPGVEQASPHALAQQNGQALVLLSHSEGGLAAKRTGGHTCRHARR